MKLPEEPKAQHSEQGLCPGHCLNTLPLRGRVQRCAAGLGGTAGTQDTCQKQASCEQLQHTHASVWY